MGSESLRQYRMVFSGRQVVQKRLATWLSSLLGSNPTVQKQSEPPFPVRLALVSSVTAICTPSFPAIGFVNLSLRLFLTDPSLRAKFSAWIGSIFSIAFYTILPYSYEYAPLILPFAIGNGVCAGAAYSVLNWVELVYRKKLSKNWLIAGGGIGALTGLIAPPFLYGPIYSGLYGIEGISSSIYQFFWYSPLLAQTSVATGFAAGLAMYPMLYFPIHGISGRDWKSFSGTILLVTATILYELYSTNDKKSIAPKGGYVNPIDVPLINSILRYKAGDGGAFGTYSLTTNAWLGPPSLKEKGETISADVREYQKPTIWSSQKKHTFDRQILSFLYEYIDVSVAEKNPDNLVVAEDDRTLQKLQIAMLQTDCIADILLTGEQGVSLVSKVPEKLKDYGIVFHEREIRNLRSASLGVNLMMTHHLGYLKNGKSVASMEERQQLEQWIRKRVPGILLYKSDEFEGLRGQSIESQLEEKNWKPRLTGWQEWRTLREKEVRQIVVNGIMLTTGVLVASIFLSARI